VDARERWQALQANLNVARASVQAGDRTRALEAVDAALAIDPEFLAAQSLRDRIVKLSDLPVAAPSAPPPPSPSLSRPSADPFARRPLVSTEGYARFEERAKRRRVDKRIEAARSAIERKKLREAASALDEVIELDPNLPELATLTAAFDQLRRSTVRSDRGPWFAAALVFGTMVLAASWIEESRVLQSRSVTTGAPLVAARSPEPIVLVEPTPEAAQPAGTADAEGRLVEASVATKSPEPIDRTPPLDRTPPPAAHEPAPVAPSAPQPVRAPAQVAPPPSAPPPPLPAPTIQDLDASAAPPRASAQMARAAEPAATLPAVVPASTPVIPPSSADELQVKQVLQRYRVAYEGLDAQSAQAIWPAVNEVALARAFDGLESQRLTFEACNVDLKGNHALAICRGTARYVPKIGSRQPRIEPRIWSFALRKIGADWKIDNARAER
jgi:tetratricopeptide (TPR) repeat protein